VRNSRSSCVMFVVQLALRAPHSPANHGWAGQKHGWGRADGQLARPFPTERVRSRSPVHLTVVAAVPEP
jgi:hypothetical protein